MNEKDQINNLLKTYEKALNTSDVAAILPLYAQDGIFMPQYSPAQVGIASVEAAYRHVFQILELDVVFTIHEIVVAGELAYARTSSKGKQTLLEPNLMTDEYNNELFIFHKEDGIWKIARYLFTTANPPS